MALQLLTDLRTTWATKKAFWLIGIASWLAAAILGGFITTFFDARMESRIFERNTVSAERMSSLVSFKTKANDLERLVQQLSYSATITSEGSNIFKDQIRQNIADQVALSKSFIPYSRYPDRVEIYIEQLVRLNNAIDAQVDFRTNDSFWTTTSNVLVLRDQIIAENTSLSTGA